MSNLTTPQPFRIRLRGVSGGLAGYWYLRLHGAGWLLTYQHLRRKCMTHDDGQDFLAATASLARSLEAHVNILFEEARQTSEDFRRVPHEWDRPGFRPGTAQRRLAQLTNHLLAFQRDWDARIVSLVQELATNGWPPPPRITMPWHRPVVPQQVLS